jgi:hypothetical protein
VGLRRPLGFFGIAIATGALVVAIALSVRQADAQVEPGGSVRIATDHWAYEYIARLRRRGYLTALNPLVQPYRAADVARAVAQIDPDTIAGPAAEWIRLLASEFGWRTRQPALPPVRWGAAAAAGLRASTSRRLDPLRPTGNTDSWPRGQLGAWFETGPIAIETRLLGDRYLAEDPDGRSPGQRRGARSDHAYVAADFPTVSIELGRLSRNWSSVGDHGLMVSDASTPYPQVGLDIRAWRFALRSFLGELETIDGHRRYLSAHRLDYERASLVLSFGESMLFAPDVGGFSLRYLNPAEFLFFDHGNQPEDQTPNLTLDLQGWGRVGDVVLTAEALLDDLDIDPLFAGGDPAPPRYAFTLRGSWIPRTGRVEVIGEYQQVSSYAYRTSMPSLDRYSYLGRGIGENYADFDRLTVGLEYAAPVRGLWVRPGATLLRQGEGDLRAPFPTSVDAFYQSPWLFLGVREATTRVGLAGRYQPTRFAWLAWDVGYNWIHNHNHVQGTTDNLLSATAQLGVRVDLPLRRGS